MVFIIKELFIEFYICVYPIHVRDAVPVYNVQTSGIQRKMPIYASKNESSGNFNHFYCLQVLNLYGMDKVLPHYESHYFCDPNHHRIVIHIHCHNQS